MKRYSGFWLAAMLLLNIQTGNADTSPAGDVTITVLGRVVAKPCTIETLNADVMLGTLSTAALATSGAASAWQNVHLNLTNCPVGTSRVTANFSGTEDASREHFKNLGSAQNLALQLADSKGENIPNGGSLTVDVNDASQSASFVLQVRAITPSGNTTQGTIQSTINVTYTWL